MGIKSLFGFSQARDKPVDKAADAGYSFLFGRTTSGKPVNEMTAMQTTAVYACVRILSEAVASLPIHVYQYKEGGGKEMVYDHSLYQVLHDEPNPEMTSFVFRETLMSHLLIWGMPMRRSLEMELVGCLLFIRCFQTRWMCSVMRRVKFTTCIPEIQRRIQISNSMVTSN